MFRNIGAAVVTSLAFCGAAHAAEVFFEDFDGVVTGGTELGGVLTTYGVQGFDGIGDISGNFLRNIASGDPAAITTLSLAGLADHDEITVEFDLALIDSWDGASGPASPDWFNLSLDTVEIFEITFDNVNVEATTVPDGATLLSSGANLGFSTFTDAVFSISLTIAHSSDTAVFFFGADGGGWQGGNDESWAMDNLRVSISNVDGPLTPVPLPASFPMLAMGLIAIGFLRGRMPRD